MENFETIKNIVKELLETDEKSRNSDKWLTIEVLRKLGFKIYVDYKELDNMPSSETIRRTRQKLQEESPNLRADEQIQELREKRKEEFSSYFSQRSRGVEVINQNFTNAKGVEIFER